MASDTPPPTSRARRLWQLICLVLVVTLVGQLALLMMSRAGHKAEALKDSRDIAINLKTGDIVGTLYTPPDQVPPPVAATTPEETPPDGAGPDGTPVDGAAKPAPAAAKPMAAPGVRVPLYPSPNPALVEMVDGLALPKIGPKGLTPAAYYAKPVKADPGMPRIAIVIDGLGLSADLSAKATALPEDVALAFSPYGADLKTQSENARKAGHEVWLDIPLQPQNFPLVDAGPFALLTTQSAEQNVARLHQVLGSAVGYAGLIAPPADIMSANSLVGPLAEEMRVRGLFLAMTDDLTLMPRYDAMRIVIDRGLPDTATPDRVRALLGELELAAKNKGYASASLAPSPATIAEIAAWAPELAAKQIQLVPLSHVKPQADESEAVSVAPLPQATGAAASPAAILEAGPAPVADAPAPAEAAPHTEPTSPATDSTAPAHVP